MQYDLSVKLDSNFRTNGFYADQVPLPFRHQCSIDHNQIDIVAIGPMFRKLFPLQPSPSVGSHIKPNGVMRASDSVGVVADTKLQIPQPLVGFLDNLDPVFHYVIPPGGFAGYSGSRNRPSALQYVVSCFVLNYSKLGLQQIPVSSESIFEVICKQNRSWCRQCPGGRYRSRRRRRRR